MDSEGVRVNETFSMEGKDSRLYVADGAIFLIRREERLEKKKRFLNDRHRSGGGSETT